MHPAVIKASAKNSFGMLFYVRSISVGPGAFETREQLGMANIYRCPVGGSSTLNVNSPKQIISDLQSVRSAFG